MSRLSTAKHGLVRLPGRWVVEWDFASMRDIQRLARDQERLAQVLRGFHLIAFRMRMWTHDRPILSGR